MPKSLAVKAQIDMIHTKRRKLLEDSRKIVEKATGEKREIDANEQTTLEKMNAELESLDGRVSTLESELFGAEDEESRDDDEDKDKGKTVADDDKRGRKAGEIVILPNGQRAEVLGSGSEVRRARADTTNKRHAWENDSEYQIRCRRNSPEYQAACAAYLSGGKDKLREFMGGEKRTVQADLDIVGGFLVLPEQFVNQILKAADNETFIGKEATIFRVDGAQTLGVPTLETDPDDADWTSELATGSLDDAVRFGKRELKPQPMAKRILVSNKLQRLSSVTGVMSVNDESTGQTGSGFVSFVTGRIGYKFGVTKEKAAMTGTGIGQALGVFVASTRGISTGRDVTTTAVAALNFDSLIEAKYTLKVPYQKRAKWLWGRPSVRRIRQLKDSMGQYLWQPSMTAGTPDMLLDFPVMMSEYCPNTYTTGSYVGMLADWSWYWQAESVQFQIQQLNELYAEKNLTGFIARTEMDGMPALEEAFARIKLG